MNKNRVAKGLNEPPVAFWLWTTMGRTDIQGMKEISPIKVGVVDVVVVRRFIFSRRGNGRNITSDIERRGQAKEPLWNEATTRVAGDAIDVGDVVKEVEVARVRSRRRVARGHGSPRRGDSGHRLDTRSRG